MGRTTSSTGSTGVIVVIVGGGGEETSSRFSLFCFVIYVYKFVSPTKTTNVKLRDSIWSSNFRSFPSDLYIIVSII